MAEDKTCCDKFAEQLSDGVIMKDYCPSGYVLYEPSRHYLDTLKVWHIRFCPFCGKELK